MRNVPLIIVAFFSLGAAFASEIREFDLNTKNRLGRQLINPPPSGSGVRARAKRTGMAAVKGMLVEDLRYSYAVLDDPDGSGFLVYALTGHRLAYFAKYAAYRFSDAGCRDIYWEHIAVSGFK